MTDADGDGIYELSLVTTDALEFKYHVCNSERFETLLFKSCTLETGEYINRLLGAGEGTRYSMHTALALALP